MTLASNLLRRLADWRPAAPGDALTVAGDDGAWTCVATAEAVERLAADWHAIDVKPAAPRDGDLAPRAAAVAGRAKGLLEPLKLIEVDAGRGVAMLRSDEPARDGGDVSYYEVLLHAGGAAGVRRYAATPAASNARRAVTFALTHEVLARLLAALTAD